MTPALAALAAVDFGRAADLWTDSPHHVDDVNGDVADRILAEFFVRTRASGANPIGRILPGGPGAGKTHLMGALRRRVWEGGGWFVGLDLHGVVDFWRTAASGLVESLARPMAGGRRQGGAVLMAALKAVGADPAAREVIKAQPQLARAGALDLMLAMLDAVEPVEAERRRDVVRALALMQSRDAGVGALAAGWLQGEAPARLGDLGFAGGPPPPAEIVRGLLWLMALGGPTLIAVDGIDAVAAEAIAGGARGGEILQGVTAGLSELHAGKRRALTLVCCRPASWAQAKGAAAEAFREFGALREVASAALAHKLVERRLATAYARLGFAPPYAAYPFPHAAFAGAVGLSPRAILRRAEAHRDACLAAGVARECADLSASQAPAEPDPQSLAALDEDFAAALAEAEAAPLDGEALAAACALYLRQLRLPEGVEATAISAPAALDAQLRFAFAESGRERRWSFCILPQGEDAVAARLRAAVSASGVGAGLAGRRLLALGVAGLTEAGAEIVAPDPRDFAVIAALRRLDGEAGPAFGAWLRLRQPLLATRLFQAAGLAPPDFLAPEPPAAKPSRDLTLGCDPETGAPVTLTVAALAQHVGVFGADAAQRGAALARLVAEAARLGVSAIVVEPDAGFAHPDLFAPAEVVVWTPGGGERPLTLPPLPDFTGLDGHDPETVEARESAVEMALAGLEPHLFGGGAKAIKLRGVLADALRLFARSGGGSLDELVRSLGDLPEGASRIAEAGALAHEIAEQLLAAMATDPLLRAGGAPVDPALLFAGGGGRTRVSLVSLAGLETDAARVGFVHQLHMALASGPDAPGRLYALGEAQLFAPAKDLTPARRSLLALLAGARQRGLGLVLCAPAAGALDPAVVAACATHVQAEAGAPVLFRLGDAQARSSAK